MAHFIVLALAIIGAMLMYAWSIFKPKPNEWELTKKLGATLGVYKLKKVVRRGKFEIVYTTYAILKNTNAKHFWHSNWRISKGGHAIDIDRISLKEDTSEHFYEMGFTPGLGVYVTYTGEEDDRDYTERIAYVVKLHKATQNTHALWRKNKVPTLKVWLREKQWAFIVFSIIGFFGFIIVPSFINVASMLHWALFATGVLSLVAGIAIGLKTYQYPMFLSTILKSMGLVAITVFSSALLLLVGINNVAFETVCSGSVPVERFWSEHTNANRTLHYADITIPLSCDFDARRVPVSSALYTEFQNGRKVVDVLVEQGRLGFKRISLIGS